MITPMSTYEYPATAFHQSKPPISSRGGGSGRRVGWLSGSGGTQRFERSRGSEQEVTARSAQLDVGLVDDQLARPLGPLRNGGLTRPRKDAVVLEHHRPFGRRRIAAVVEPELVGS